MHLTRRSLLQIGAAGVFGALAPPAYAGGSPSRRRARAKSVIFLHQFGGPSHLDSFDMKPDAPAQVRGDYRPIATSAPGIVICDQLPHMAPHMNKVTLVRTVQHRMNNHNSAGYYSLTGYNPPTDDQRLRDSRELFPTYGSIVDRFAPSPAGVPTFVSYPPGIRDGSITSGQHASFLGQSYDPFFFTQDPN